jgi:hypothetical protein
MRCQKGAGFRAGCRAGFRAGVKRLYEAHLGAHTFVAGAGALVRGREDGVIIYGNMNRNKAILVGLRWLKL